MVKHNYPRQTEVETEARPLG